MADSPARVVPFTARTAPAALEDLRARLRATRWPDAPEDAVWSIGTDLTYLRELVAYWADGFDWPAQEAALARLPRFRVRLGGLGIHFVHARAAAPAGPVLPLVLCHGWPDSFWRYAKVIPLLADPGGHGADPSDAFDVVVPDMPGYGYSDRPTRAPLDSIAVAGLWAELMDVLGYTRFGTAGGDMGSHVSRYLGLNDSPAGLAAWIVEKLRAWSDCDGDIERRFAKDEILTNVTLYWLTETIGSSMRMYRANAAIPPAQLSRRVEVPSGFSLFPGDIVRPPRAWLERTAKVVRVTEPARGGHFAPFEEPELYAEELRAFFRPYRGAVTG
ncbi:MAG: epoxide hydrolase [Acidimicrobiales bacterium]